MSLAVMNAVWSARSDRGTPLTSPTDRFVLLALADDSDEDGYCMPSHGRICRKTGLSDGAVRKSIRKLEGDGLLKRAARQRGNGSDTSNVTRIDIRALGELKAVTVSPANDNPYASYFEAEGDD